jgi:carboxyl-terminal processing protease
VAALDIALSDSLFQQTNGLFQQTNRLPNSPRLTPDQLASVRHEMAQTLKRHSVHGPSDLVTLARDMALLLERQVGLRQNATLLEFVTSAAGGLDNYSAYLTGNQLRDVYSQIEGNFVGLGIELRADKGALLIVHVIPNSPAEKAGIRKGDRIVGVDGQTISSFSTDEAAALLTGKEGTWVQVTAYAPGQQPRELRIRREHVNVPSLEGVKIVDTDFGVAYVRLPAFQKTTSRDLEAALWDLHRKGMRSLVLDLRGNPGGLLTASVEVADKFLTKGNIVSTRGRSEQEDFNYQAHYGGTWRVPLVVLIDGDSASASEIFASAIKENNRGLLVGDRSYGKGSVQGIFPLGYAGSGIRLTTAKFFSPTGQAISHHGVMPDRTIKAHQVARPTDQGLVIEPAAQDAALDAAIEQARGRVAAR